MVGDVEIVEPEKAKMEADHVDTQVSKIGAAFLGMTLGCARCHDHKFDPIGLNDYYGIAGMLRSSPSTHKVPFGVWSKLNATELPETPEQLETRHKLEADHAVNLAAMKAERHQLEMEKKTVAEAIAQLEQAAQAATATPSETAANEAAASEATPSEETKTVQTDAEIQEKKSALTKRRDELNQQTGKLNRQIQHAEFFASKVPKAFAMRDGEQPADMPIYIRGNPYAPGAIVPRGTLRVASRDKLPDIPAGQSGRLQLADWLADSRNPLTPRVAVNRIWQKLMGEGLVRGVDYFGTRGEQPSHPELLDHLAITFMKNGWSQKQLIRSIVLSRTYRMGSANNDEAMNKDPENRLLWRMNRQRLDAESLRDGLLAVSGELKPSSGGPALVLESPENCGDLVQQGVNPPNYHHRQPRAGEEFLRTIYLPVLRTSTATNDRLRSFFDFVNPAQISGQRSQTVAPTQSLFVLNNALFRMRAKSLADQLIAASPQNDARLNQLWLRVFNRPITNSEREEAIAFLTQLDNSIDNQDTTARESQSWQELCHSLLASNEFLFRI
jgi:hypothetical protein